MQTPMLELTFGKSASVHYEDAARLAQRLDGYRTSASGRQVLHVVTWSGSLAQEEIWEPLQRLLQLVSGWRSARLRLGDKEVHYPTLAGWLFHVRACYKHKLQ